MSERRRAQPFLGEGAVEHIFLKPEELRGRPSRKKKKGRLGAKKSTIPFTELKRSFLKTRDASLEKKKVYEDPDMYFILTFSDSLRSPIIRNVLDKLEVRIVDAKSDKSVKVSLPKSAYESFLRRLEPGSKYVQEIREVGMAEKVDESLMALLQSETERERKINVTVELSSLLGLHKLEELKESITNFITKSENGVVLESYISDYFWLFGIMSTCGTVRAIAEEVDAVDRIQRIPKMSLKKAKFFLSSVNEGRNKNRVILPSMNIPLRRESGKVDELPTVCIIDSGVNKDHKFLKQYIKQTFDRTTMQPQPCDDEIGHGSKVAGMAIYRGDVQAGMPYSSVIMVKAFRDYDEFVGDVLTTISDTVDRYCQITKVFNLSFSGVGPNISLSRALDDLAHKKDVIFVVCGGNIPPSSILGELRSGSRYPEYLGHYLIYFPGDCINAITVGSYAKSSSNFIPAMRPSPHTRTYMGPNFTRIKPELLEDGGNLNVEYDDGNIVNMNYAGCGIRSSSKEDDEIVEDAGSSFASPIIASICASILNKFPGISSVLAKALVISSCEQLRDSSQNPFDSGIQGFGVPDRGAAIDSMFWRVNYCASAQFDLTQKRLRHRYRFLFPDAADRVIVTSCFSVCPIVSGQDLPYRIEIRMHKPGVKLETSVRPDYTIEKPNANTMRHEYHVERGGKGAWTLDVIPRVSPVLSLTELRRFALQLRYAIVVTVVSDSHIDLIRAIRTWHTKTLQR